MLDERFHTTKRNSKLEVMKVVQNSERLLLATLDKESDIGTRARVLFLEDADLLLTHGLAARVVDGFHCGVSKKEVNDLTSIICLSTHAKLKSGEGAGQEPGSVGLRDCSEDSAHCLDLADKLFAASCKTSNDIRVAADELGCRVHNNISAKLVWMGENGTTEGVIDNEKAVVLLGNAGCSLQISHSDGWVGRSLDVDDLALALALGDGSLDFSLRAAGVEGVGGDLEGRQDCAHEHLSATVNGIREADVISGTKESQAGGGDCSHATAHEGSSLGLGVPDADLVFKDFRVGISHTAVDHCRDLTLLSLSQAVSDLKGSLALFRVLEHES